MATTNHIGLTQLEGHEYYSHIKENENLTKIDEALKENNDRTTVIEDKINKKEKLTINLSSASRVVSVNDSYAGACEVEFKGWTAENILKDGNFSDVTSPFKTSTRHWMSLMGTILATPQNGILKMSDEKAAGWSGLVNVDRFVPVVDDKYYVYSRVRVLDTLSNGLGIYFAKVSDWQPNGTQVRVNMPVINRWYDLHGIISISLATLSCFNIGFNYPYDPMSKGKAVEVDTKRGLFAIKLTCDDLILTAEQLKSKYIDDGYQEGLFNAKKPSITMIGENLLDIRAYKESDEGMITSLTATGLSVDYTKGGAIYIDGDFKSGTYTFKAINNVPSGKHVAGVFWEEGYATGSSHELWMEQTFDTTKFILTKDYKSFSINRLGASDPNMIVKFSEIMLVEGSTAPTTYIPYQSNNKVYEGEFAGLPNGVADSISDVNGKTVKTINTNFGRDGEYYKVSELPTINTILTNVDLAFFQFVEAKIGSSVHNHNPIVVEGTPQIPSSICDNLSYIGSFYYSDNRIRLVVAKGTTAQQAYDYIKNKNVLYQLLEPIILKLPQESAPVVSYDGYTQLAATIDMTVKYSSDLNRAVSTMSDAVSNMGKTLDEHGRLLEDGKKLKVELDGSNSVKSVVDAYNGGTSFVVEGALRENYIYKEKLGKGYYPDANRTLIGNPDVYRSCGLTLPIGDYTVTFSKPVLIAKRILDGIYSNPGLSNITEYRISVTIAGFVGLSFRQSQGGVDWDNAIDIMWVKDSEVCNSYFEGLQHNRGVVIETVGKNLFDGKWELGGYAYFNGANYDVVDRKRNKNKYIRVNGNTNYNMWRELGKALNYFWFDSNFKFLEHSLMYENAVKSPMNATYVNFTEAGKEDDLHERLVFSVNSMKLLKYEPYQSSKIIVNAGAKLLNGVKDSIERMSDGRTIEHVKTNVLRDGDFYEIKTGDVRHLETGGTLVDYVLMNVSNLNGVKPQTNGVDNTIYVEKFGDEIITANAISSIGKIATSATDIYIIFQKGKYATLAEAQDDLTGTKIAYQLATPYDRELDMIESLNTYDDYTQFSVSGGGVKYEKSNYVAKADNSRYYFNVVGHPSTSGKDSPFKYKMKVLNDIIFNGRSIKDLCDIEDTCSYGDIRFSISEVVKEKNNIDINDITINYTTQESCNQPNVIIKYNADMSSAVSSNANSINIVGEQTDKNTKELDRFSKPLEWIEPTLLNGTINIGGGYPNMSYAIREDRVYVKGTVTTAAHNIHVCTLPKTTYGQELFFFSDKSNAFGRCWIEANTGRFIVGTAGGNSFGFDYEYGGK